MHVKKRGGRGHPKLEASMLAAIKEALATQTFAQVGARYDVTAQSIRNFVTRHGLECSQFKKGRSVRKAKDIPDDNEWPDAIKPVKPPAEANGVKFKTVTVKRGYGHPAYEMQVPEAIGTETDAETGATVTKYPPMYAFGAGPQKNIHVKGGS
jgi:hypothetical protein